MSDEKKIKSKLPKETQKDLVGFEEVLDLLEDQTGKKKVGAITKDNQSDNYDLFHFLEQELMRLEKLHLFWSQQYPSMLKNEKMEYLIKRHRELNYELREQIITKLMPGHSGFHAQMRYVWDKSMLSD